MVACVVVNWNGWQDTLACLRTLALQETAEELRVYVVDNGSTNESVDRIQHFIDTQQSGRVQFYLVRNSRNAGFSGGTNLGLQQGLDRGAEFLWLLNNDTECPPDTVEKLVQAARQRPDAGIIGTILYYFHQPVQVQAWGGGHINRFLATSTHCLTPTEPAQGFYATFASAIIRADVFGDIGLLDDGFFMYYDDADFCLRMERTRWKIAIADGTAVLHKEGASTKGARNPFMEKTIVASGLRLLKRHSPVPLLSQVAFVLLKFGNRLRRGEWAACAAVLRGIGEYGRTAPPHAVLPHSAAR